MTTASAVSPAPATYHRRFLLLRCFMRWVSHRNGLPDPFLELQAPPKPRQESDWLTREEFAQAAARRRDTRRAVVPAWPSATSSCC